MKTQVRPAATPPRQGFAARRAAVLAGVLVPVLLLGALAAWWLTSESGYALVIEKPTGGSLLGRYISCGTIGSSCTSTRARGEVVEIVAQPDEGYVFAGYTGDCESGGRVLMDRPRSCGARFDPLPGSAIVRRRLTIDRPVGGTIVSDVGIECGDAGTNCSVDVADGSLVTLDSAPAEGYALQQYTGDCAPHGATTMTEARRCGAVFAKGAQPLAPPPAPVADGRRQDGPPETSGGADTSRSSGTGAGAGPGAATGAGATSAAGTGAGTPRDAGGAAAPAAPAPAAPAPLGTSAPAPTTGPDEARPAGPEGPARSPTEIAHQEITTVLNAYRDAYSRMAVNDMQALHPTMDMRRFQVQFKDLKSVAYSFAGPPEFSDLDLQAGKVKAVAGVTIEMDARAGGKQKPLKHKATFLLNRVGETARWTIADITYQQ